MGSSPRLPLGPSGESRRARVRAAWTPPPGPLPAGSQGDPELEPGEGESLDALAGEWRIFQRRDGHRYSTDDLLAAWFASRAAADRGIVVRRALDLGAGIGSIAMMVAWRLPEAHVVGIEAQAISAGLFARSIRYNGAVGRVELRVGDLRDPATRTDGAVFDLVTGSPPYFVEGEGITSDRPQRGPCRFEHRGGLEAYVDAASATLAPSGVFVLVHTYAVRERVRAAAEGARLALVRTLPVVFRAGRAPYLALYELARAGARPPEGEHAPLVTRDADGRRTAAFAEARLSIGFPP